MEIDVRDSLGGADGADLRRIEGATARTDTVGSADFADREEMAEIGFPPEIDGKAAIAMLCADGRLQRLMEVNAMFRIEFDTLRIHVHKSFVRRCLCRARF